MFLIEGQFTGYLHMLITGKNVGNKNRQKWGLACITAHLFIEKRRCVPVPFFARGNGRLGSRGSCNPGELREQEASPHASSPAHTTSLSPPHCFQNKTDSFL